MPRSGWAREPWPRSLRVRSLCSATGEAATVRRPRTAKTKNLVTIYLPHGLYIYVGLSLLRPLPLRSTGSGRAGSAAMAHGPSRSAACGIFPDWGTNPCPLHQQADSQLLRHQGSPNITFICTGKPKNSCYLLCCKIHFIVMIWNQTLNISEVCLYC